MRSIIGAMALIGFSRPAQSDVTNFGPWHCSDKPHPICSHKSFNILIYGRVLCPTQAGETVRLGDMAYGFRTANGLLRFLAFPIRRLHLIADGEIFALPRANSDVIAAEYLCDRHRSLIFGKVKDPKNGEFYLWSYSTVSRF
jgi:hypothetical protein